MNYPRLCHRPRLRQEEQKLLDLVEEQKSQFLVALRASFDRMLEKEVEAGLQCGTFKELADGVPWFVP